MPNFPTQTLRALWHAVELQYFTAPQLAAVSGTSYETVKKVLRTEDGRTIVRTGKRSTSALGRPADIWEVSDAAAIRERFEGVRDQLEELRAIGIAGEAEATEAEVDSDTALATAEDQVLFAFQADDRDSQRLASEALATLQTARVHWTDLFSFEDILPGFPVQSRNLPSRIARGWVLGTIARYLASDECTGFSGPLWRGAFAAVAAVDDPAQDALHKRFLVELVRHAESKATTLGSDLFQAEISGLELSPSDFGRRLVRYFFTILAQWKMALRSKDDGSDTPAPPELLERLEDLADIVFPLLDRTEKELLLVVLTDALGDPRGVSTATRILLRLRKESDLVSWILNSETVSVSRSQDLTDWYLGLRHSASLSVSQRIALINAFQDALPRQQSEGFFQTLALTCPPQDVPELTENSRVPTRIRADVELQLMLAYTPEAPHLEEIAAGA
jgi:hypothetical protein